MSLSWFNPLDLQDLSGSLALQVFLVVLGTLLLNLLTSRTLSKLLEQAERTRSPWDEALVGAATRPAGVLIWVAGLSFAASMVAAHTQAPIFNALEPVRLLGIIATLTWFLLRLVGSLEQAYYVRLSQTQQETDQTTIEAISKLLRAALVITSILVGLQSLGFSVSGVLAFGGIGGIAIGFAAKDLLANFFGAMMIYLDRPFAVGDWIRSPDKDIEGVVEHIGWRLSRIRRFDKRPLYLPNSIFTQIAVENPSRMTHRRIFETIGIRYADMDRIEPITQAVKAMLSQHEGIDSTQTLMVNFDAFNASSIDFFIYALTHTTDWTQFHAIKQDILLRVAAIIDSHGAEIAFPTHTLHLGDEALLQSLQQATTCAGMITPMASRT